MLPTLAETPFSEREFAALWYLATATYGVGDIVTTVAIVRFVGRLRESNILLDVVMGAFGTWGLVAVKLAVFFVCFGISLSAARAEDRFLYYFPPVALAVIGAFTTAFNVRLLFG